MAFSVTEFESIYKRCFPMAMGVAERLLYDREEARDVVQQVFASLWESELNIANPEAFVFRAVRNLCLNRIAATNIHERVKRLYSLELQTAPDIDHRIDQVQEAIAHLSVREQQVVQEVFAYGNSYADAALHLNLSVSSINKYIVSALKSLRNQLIYNKS